MSAEQSKLDLAACERALANTQNSLHEERLEHGAARNALHFETEKHRETEKLFDLTYEAARQSGILADGLRAQVAELQGGPAISEPVLTTSDLMFDLQLTKYKLHWLEDWVSSNGLHPAEHNSNTVQQGRHAPSVDGDIDES